MRSLEDMHAISYNDRDCFECQISTISDWWNDMDADTELCLMGSWNFSFQGEGTIGERIQIINNMSEYLKQYFGIDGYEKVLSGKEEKYTFIEHELNEGRPVFASIMSKYVPWDPDIWGDGSDFHVVIVKGIDKEKKFLTIVDSFYGKDNEQLSFSNFELGVKDEMVGFQFSIPELRIAEKRWEDILKESLEPMSGKEKTGFAQMREFAKSFLNMEDVKEELLSEKAYVGSVLYKQVLRIINSRKQYAVFLRCLFRISKMDILFQLAGEMEIASEMWHKIQLMLVKSSLKKNFDQIVEVASFIEKVTDYEENTFTRLLLLTNGEGYKEILHPEKILFSCNVPIDLLCNNKGFGPMNTATKANIHPPIDAVPEHERNEYMNQVSYYYEEDFPENGIVELDGLKFTLIRSKETGFDNMICRGQMIEIEEHDINTIYLIGCSEYGNHSEELIVHFLDGTIQKIVFGLTDWWFKPHFNDRVVWQGRSVIWSKGRAFIDYYTHYIYAVKLDIENNSGVRAIEFPVCENMHIFSIAVAKAVTSL